ncbi:ClpXP protease specificity-enhancing factor [Pseudomonadota bacterium]
MTSTKPYLIRAIRDWAIDNNLTPQILVDTTVDGVVVPSAYIRDNQIVLNVDDAAIQSINFGNDWVIFSARFTGSTFNVEIPIPAVQAIYARENRQGVFFQIEDPDQPTDPNGGATSVVSDNTRTSGNSEKPDKKKSHLKLIK